MGLFLRLLPFLIIALLVLIPTRRLFLAGWQRSYLLTYFVVVVALGAIVAELEVAARYLVPILVIAYIAPFVTAGAGIARLIGRSRGGGRSSDVGPVVRRVTPIHLPPTTAGKRRFTRYDGVDDDDRSAPESDESGSDADEDPQHPEDPARSRHPAESDPMPTASRDSDSATRR